MKTNEIRRLFLQYFADNNHEIVSSSSLVPGDDPTLLFTNAGMVQFKEVFLGQEKRPYKRATTSQRCVRAGGKHNDLENVGYTARHHTFFEMLGNFSFGDYFKERAIELAYAFLTEELGFAADKLWVTVYLDDDEAADIWQKQIGIPIDRIVRKDEKDNFWQMGDVGPCGPCTEIFYDHGPEVKGGPPGSADEDGDRYIEIWNLVFMQYNRQEDGTLEPLPCPSVDTGMGLERLAAVMQHVHSNYDIDLFVNLIEAAAKATGVANTQDEKSQSLKVIADHIRSTAFLIVDGVLPSNEGRGYVLRRIIRRAIRHGYRLGCKETFFSTMVEPLVKEMGDAYPELQSKKDRVAEVLLAEERRFARTIENGLGMLDDAIGNANGGKISGGVAFTLYDTYGFPLDLTQDVAREHNLEVDVAAFDSHMEEQRQRARSSSQFKSQSGIQVDGVDASEFVGYEFETARGTVMHILKDHNAVDGLEVGDDGIVITDRTPFYAESGGQVGDNGTLEVNGSVFTVTNTQKTPNGVWLHFGSVTSGSIVKGTEVELKVDGHRRKGISVHHSATHLLHAALKTVLGNHVAQRGSLVAEDRLRFDFTHDAPMSTEQRTEVERWVNHYVRQNYAVEIEEMALDQAKARGATALFGEKYGDEVRVVSMGPDSMELCGGIHVSQTGNIGQFTLLEEGSVASGVRRVEAAGGGAAEQVLAQSQQQVSRLCELLKVRPHQLVERSEGMVQRIRELEKENKALKVEAVRTGGEGATAEVLGNIEAKLIRIEDIDSKGLRQMLDAMRKDFVDGVIVMVSVFDARVACVVSVSDDLVSRIKAGEVVKEMTTILGGKGGGKANFAQGGGSDVDRIDDAFDKARAMIASA